jgi:PleD family two-component response regulator
MAFRPTDFAKHLCTSEEGIAMTVSIGVASYLIEGDTEQTIIARADEAMYKASTILSKRC